MVHHEHSKRGNAWALILSGLFLTAAATAVTTAICYRASRTNWVRSYAQAQIIQQHNDSDQQLDGGSTTAKTAAKTAAAGSKLIYAWETEMNASAPIPMQLWQTSRSSDVGKQAQAAMQTWRTQNRNITATLHNDTAAADFIQQFYGSEAHRIFQSFPLGVMRGDFWRYAVLYAYGGIYADIDTKCMKPVEQWFPPRRWQPDDRTKFQVPPFVSEDEWSSAGGLDYHKLSWNDCSIVIGLENDVHFCQWIIASVPGHPILKRVMHLMLERAKQGINITYDHMVHHHTGPGIWTQAIYETLGLQGVKADEVAKAVWTDPAYYRKARSMGLCVVAASFWGTKKPQNAWNMYGSQVFNATGYPRWIDERAELLKKVREESSIAGNKTR